MSICGTIFTDGLYDNLGLFLWIQVILRLSTLVIVACRFFTYRFPVGSLIALLIVAYRFPCRFAYRFPCRFAIRFLRRLAYRFP
jgi:hypothetical protein